MEELEKILSIDDIGYFRSLAEAKVPREHLTGYQKTETWWAWGTKWARGSSEDKSTNEILEDEYGLTPQQRRMFYQAIDYDEKAAVPLQSIDTPPGYVHMKVSFLLRKFGFILKGQEDAGSTVAEGNLDDLSVVADVRKGSFTVRFTPHPIRRLVTYL